MPHRAATTHCSRARVSGSCIRAANAALQQEEHQGAAPSSNHAFIARASGDDHLTRPETLSGNAMWKKLTTTPWRTEDARSDSRRRDVSHTAGTSEPPRR